MNPRLIIQSKDSNRVWDKFWDNASKGNYNSLTEDESKIIRHTHRQLLNHHFMDYRLGGRFDLPLKLMDGTPLLDTYHRLVIGDHGPYIEFDFENLLLPIKTKKGEEFRETENYKCKYHWKNPVINNEPIDVKIYYQIERVKYADYMVGMYYVDPYELYHIEPSTEFDLL